MVARHWGEGAVIANGLEGSFRGDANVLKLDGGDSCATLNIY